MPQPPYSPDLAYADFLAFPKLKTSIIGKHFVTIEDLKEKSKQELLANPKKRVSEGFRRLEKKLA